MGNLHSQPGHPSAQSAKLNIMTLSALGFFADKFFDKQPREWTKQALTTCKDAKEAYMVDAIAESDM